jgi:hypothetical protein
VENWPKLHLHHHTASQWVESHFGIVLGLFGDYFGFRTFERSELFDFVYRESR